MESRYVLASVMCFIFFFTGLFAVIAHDKYVNGQDLQVCLSQPNHEWTENNNNKMECVVSDE